MATMLHEPYFRWFHETGVWKRMHYHGIRTLKFPPDMWNYQEIIFERGIRTVIETGTRHGGSALFFADTLRALGGGKVISVDIDDSERVLREHPDITFLVGDSAAPAMVEQVMAMLPPAPRAPLFLILDSDHRAAHVLRELRAWIARLSPGDYVIVEDSCVNGHPVRPEHGPGPWEALETFLAEQPTLLNRDAERENKFGATAAPFGFWVRQ
jgi:cephalosporin hydroxylase